MEIVTTIEYFSETEKHFIEEKEITEENVHEIYELYEKGYNEIHITTSSFYDIIISKLGRKCVRVHHHHVFDGSSLPPYKETVYIIEYFKKKGFKVVEKDTEIKDFGTYDSEKKRTNRRFQW